MPLGLVGSTLGPTSGFVERFCLDQGIGRLILKDLAPVFSEEFTSVRHCTEYSVFYEILLRRRSIPCRDDANGMRVKTVWARRISGSTVGAKEG
jgi:hypothetical protein